MITGGAKAEEAGNLIKSVWYNAIYEERDNTTDKYTRPDGFFVDDFNDALANLFADTTFTEIIEEIKENQKVVSGYMKDLIIQSENASMGFLPLLIWTRHFISDRLIQGLNPNRCF